MSIYMINKTLPWTSLDASAARDHVAKMMISSVADRTWTYTRLWLISYVFAGRGSADLYALFDTLKCRAHIRPIQMDVAAHLLPLGVRTTAVAQSGARVLMLDYSPIDWAMYFADAPTFCFLASHGAPLDPPRLFSALGSPCRDIETYAARAFALPPEVHLPPACFLSVDQIKLMLVRGMRSQESTLWMHCDSAATFVWCERNLPAAFDSFGHDEIQRMVYIYVVYGRFDLATYLLTKPDFATLFPVNRTLRALLNKTTPEAVCLLHLIYNRRPAPITFDNGITALQHAAQFGNLTMVRALLDCGDHAFRDQTNSYPLVSTLALFGHKTAAAYARENHHEDVALAIEQYVPVDPYLTAAEEQVVAILDAKE